MSKERKEWVILGRIVGTGTGWDGDMGGMCIYDFEPATGVNIPMGDPWFMLEKGKIEYYDDDGKVTQSFDTIEILKDIPRKAD